MIALRLLLGGFAKLIPWQAWLAAGLIAAWLVSLQLARWDRDAYWEREIESRSKVVMAKIEAAGIVLAEQDRQLLETLKQENADYEAELARLKAERDSTPLSDACKQCRIPARRVRP
jgi:hypothetical protein